MNNNWTEEQEQLLITWAEKASGYAWLHSHSVNLYRHRNLAIAIPASLFGYIAGSVSLLGHDNDNNWKTVLIGMTGILAGILTSFQELFTYKQLSEQHRISGLQFMRFFRDISVELSMHPKHRTEALEYINLKRLEFDKMLEQSPPYPEKILKTFNKKFSNAMVHKPDIANKLQTIIPYRKRMECLKPNEMRIARKYFNMWRKKMAITNRNLVMANVREKSIKDTLVEVANSEFSGRPLSFTNGRFLSSQISISTDTSLDSIKSNEINEIINSNNQRIKENTML
jgi:hypothetical protein